MYDVVGHWAKDCREKPRDGRHRNNGRGRSPRRDYGGRDTRRYYYHPLRPITICEGKERETCNVNYQLFYCQRLRWVWTLEEVPFIHHHHHPLGKILHIIRWEIHTHTHAQKSLTQGIHFLSSFFLYIHCRSCVLSLSHSICDLIHSW